jgi:hypothetical protein
MGVVELMIFYSFFVYDFIIIMILLIQMIDSITFCTEFCICVYTGINRNTLLILVNRNKKRKISNMDGRKRLSGSAYRKLAKENEEREAELKAKIPKISTFFKPHSIEPDLQCRSTTSTAINVDVEPEIILFPSPTPVIGSK